MLSLPRRHLLPSLLLIRLQNAQMHVIHPRTRKWHKERATYLLCFSRQISPVLSGEQRDAGVSRPSFFRTLTDEVLHLRSLLELLQEPTTKEPVIRSSRPNNHRLYAPEECGERSPVLGVRSGSMKFGFTTRGAVLVQAGEETRTDILVVVLSLLLVLFRKNAMLVDPSLRSRCQRPFPLPARVSEPASAQWCSHARPLQLPRNVHQDYPW